MKKLSVVLLLVFCLAACSQEQPLLPTVTLTQTLTPYLSPTSTSRPTRTAGPTRTRPPTLTITPTSIYPTIQPRATWTDDFVNLNEWPLPKYCSPSQGIRAPSISPDHQWLVVSECYDPDPTLVIINKIGTKSWNLHFTEYLNHHDDGTIAFEKWTNDSRYIYFYTTGYFDPIGCYYNHGGFGLFRLDVQTGETSDILPLRPDGHTYIWSFSPTGRRMLYEAVGSSINILDLKTGDISKMPALPEHTDFGGFLWSADGLSVAFTLMQQAVDGPSTYYLNLIDVNSASMRTLMKSQPDQCLAASYWLSESRLAVYSAFNYSDERGTEFEINIPSAP